MLFAAKHLKVSPELMQLDVLTPTLDKVFEVDPHVSLDTCMTDQLPVCHPVGAV